MPGTLVEIVGVVVPMVTIAGSAVAFVWKSYADARQKRRSEFFEVIDRLDSAERTTALLNALYQLRFYPEHRAFIIRYLEAHSENIKGSEETKEIVRLELTRTLEFLKY